MSLGWILSPRLPWRGRGTISCSGDGLVVGVGGAWHNGNSVRVGAVRSRMKSQHHGLLFLSLVLAVSSVSAEDVVVKISVDVSAESTRLVLNHTRQVSYLIRSSRKKITLLYSEPVKFDPPGARIGGPLFDRYRQRGPRELVIETGNQYDRFESFELRNPYRLILDLKPRLGRQQSRRGRRKPRDSRPVTIINC